MSFHTFSRVGGIYDIYARLVSCLFAKVYKLKKGRGRRRRSVAVMVVVVVHSGRRKLAATREEPTSETRSNNISKIRQDLHQKVIDIPHAAVAWHFAIRLPAADLELEHKNWLLAITYHH